MAQPSKIVRVDAYRTLAAASISGTYTAIGSSFGHTMRIIKVLNTSNQDVTISFDGTTNNDYIPAGSFSLYDMTANQENPSTGFYFQVGTQVYVAAPGSLPASGAVYIICVYGQGE